MLKLYCRIKNSYSLTRNKNIHVLGSEQELLGLLHLRFLTLILIFFFFLLFRCSFEFGEEFQYDTVTTPEKLSEMLEKSPITHVKKVVPGRECLCLTVGKCIRVNHSQCVREKTWERGCDSVSQRMFIYFFA